MVWKALDPREGATLWVKDAGDGLMVLAAGSEPSDPSDKIMLNEREFQEAGEYVGFIETHIGGPPDED